MQVENVKKVKNKMNENKTYYVHFPILISSHKNISLLS